MFEELNTGRKLGLAFGAAIATMAVVGGVAGWAASSTERIAIDLAVEKIPGLLALGEVSDAIDAADRNLSRLVNPSLGDRRERGRFTADFAAAMGDLAGAEGEYAALPRSAPLAERWRAFLAAELVWRQRAEEAEIAIAWRDEVEATSEIDDPFAIAAARSRAAVAYRAMMNAHGPASDAIEALRDQTRAEVIALDGSVGPAIRRARLALSAAFGAGAMVLVAAAALVTRTVGRGIRGLLAEARALTDAVRRGRLDVRGDPAAVSAEFRPVVEGINRTVEAFDQVRARMVEAQKLEAVGRLAGGVAHDFNNILTSIVGSAHLAREALPGDHAAGPDLDQILADAGRAAALVRQLLAFGRRGVVEARPVRVGAQLRALEPMLRRLIGEDVELSILGADAPAVVRIDPGQLEQVIVNLAVNARDAMPEGGRLAIEVGTLDVLAGDGAGLAPGRHLLLAVSDTGIGIAPEARAQIFEPFFTSKGSGKGTGLGLATCHAIVATAGGAIAFDSEPGRGTRFRVYLPCVDEPPAEEPPAPPRALAGTETLLLVEDEVAVRAVAARALRSRGYRVLEAETVEEGIARAADHPGRIDLLVSDGVLRGGSGRQVAEQVRRARPEIRVLFVSGYTDDAVVRGGIEARELAFLPKPYSPEELCAKVRAVLDG